jgi:hypothetical protein
MTGIVYTDLSNFVDCDFDIHNVGEQGNEAG